MSEVKFLKEIIHTMCHHIVGAEWCRFDKEQCPETERVLTMHCVQCYKEYFTQLTLEETEYDD